MTQARRDAEQRVRMLNISGNDLICVNVLWVAVKVCKATCIHMIAIMSWQAKVERRKAQEKAMYEAITDMKMQKALRRKKYEEEEERQW